MATYDFVAIFCDNFCSNFTAQIGGLKIQYAEKYGSPCSFRRRQPFLSLSLVFDSRPPCCVIERALLLALSHYAQNMMRSAIQANQFALEDKERH